MHALALNGNCNRTDCWRIASLSMSTRVDARANAKVSFTKIRNKWKWQQRSFRSYYLTGVRERERARAHSHSNWRANQNEYKIINLVRLTHFFSLFCCYFSFSIFFSPSPSPPYRRCALVCVFSARSTDVTRISRCHWLVFVSQPVEDECEKCSMCNAIRAITLLSRVQRDCALWEKTTIKTIKNLNMWKNDD